MPYIPSINDLPEETQSSSGYTPSLSDIHELEGTSGNKGQAFLGGLEKGAQSFLNSAVDASSTLNQLPKDSALAQHFTFADEQSPERKQAMEEHPFITEGGNVAAQVAPYAIPGAGLGRVENLGLGAIAGATSMNDSPQHMLEGAIGGAATTRAIYGLGDLASAGLSALRAPGVVKEFSDYTSKAVNSLISKFDGTPRQIAAKAAATSYNLTKEADNKLFDVFRSVPTDFDKEMSEVRINAKNMLQEHSDLLSSSQKQAIQKVVNLANQDNTIATLHDIRKTLAGQFNNFSPKENAIVSDSYKDLKNLVNQNLETMADKGGVLNEYKNANLHYQTKLLPLINANMDDVSRALSPESVKSNPKAAANVLDNWIDKNLKTNAPEQTKTLLDSLGEEGRNAVEVRSLQNVLSKVQNSPNPSNTLKTELNKLGETSDALFTDQNKALVKGSQKVLNEASPVLNMKAAKGTFTGQVEAPAIHIVSKLLETPLGQVSLRLLGEPGIPKSAVSSFLRQGSALLVGKTINQYTNPNINPEDTNNGQ